MLPTSAQRTQRCVGAASSSCEQIILVSPFVSPAPSSPTQIFVSAPNIKIEVIRIHASPSTLTATAEILVHVNDEGKTVLKVADVIAFTPDFKIKSVLAFKG